MVPPSSQGIGPLRETAVAASRGESFVTWYSSFSESSTPSDKGPRPVSSVPAVSSAASIRPGRPTRSTDGGARAVDRVGRPGRIEAAEETAGTLETGRGPLSEGVDDSEKDEYQVTKLSPREAATAVSRRGPIPCDEGGTMSSYSSKSRRS